MTRRDKYRPDMTLEDVRTYVDEHAQATGYTASIQIEFVPTLKQDARCTVQLRPLGTGLSHPPVVQTAGPIPLRQTARQVSCIFHLVAQAFYELDANPWLWTPDQRKRARGETP